MTHQAGHRNFTVATGADSRFAIRFHQDGGLVAASTLVAGDYVSYQEKIWPVYSTEDAGGGKVAIRLGKGSYFDPYLTIDGTELVPIAPAATWEEVDMQVALPDTTSSPPPATMSVPATIEDGTVCLIAIGQDWLAPFQQAIDYSSGGPSGMSLPYDLVGTFGGQRIRVLTGSINIVRSAASPQVGPPVEEVEP